MNGFEGVLVRDDLTTCPTYVLLKAARMSFEKRGEWLAMARKAYDRGDDKEWVQTLLREAQNHHDTGLSALIIRRRFYR